MTLETTGKLELRDSRQPILALGWETVHHAVDSLAYSFKDRGIKQIVAVSRGGLIPGVMLSHRLNVPLSVISAQSYEGTRRTLQKPTEILGWYPAYDSYDTLVIDDIVDSGETFQGIQRLSSKCFLSALVSKKHSHMTAHFITVDPSVWVKFPWET